MELIFGLLPLAGTILGVINILITRARTGQEDKQKLAQVSHAVSNAVEQTDAYREYLAAKNPRQPDREEELAKLWRAASFEFGQVAKTPEEHELVGRLRMKALAWDYFEQWPDKRIIEARIDFETVRAQLSELKKLTL